MGANALKLQSLISLLLISVCSARISELQQSQPHVAGILARNKELLYSRQTVAHGKDAQRRLAAGSVTVVGNGESFRSFLCKDIVKHLALSGVSKLRLCSLSFDRVEDEELFPPAAQNTGAADTDSIALKIATDEDAKQSVEAVASMIKDLNPDVHVEICDSTEATSGKAFAADALVAVNVPIRYQLRLNRRCRRDKVRYTSCSTIGLAGYVFNDFGDEVAVRDENGELFETQQHRSLEETLQMPRFAPFDSNAEPRRHHKLQSALFGYFMQRRSDAVLPLVRRQLLEDIETTLAGLNPNGSELVQVDQAAINAVYDSISEPLHAANVAMSAVVAAVAAQQCMTAITHVFVPINQLMPIAFPEASTAHGVDGPIEVADRLASLRILLAGAGAIGCELLKNLGAMGVSTESPGNVFVFDYDTVSLSNLSRQLLFRLRDVGAMKSTTAAAAMSKLAPQMRLSAMHTKIAKHMDRPLADTFWQSMDVVLMGVDNVEARTDIDDYCVCYGLPMIDSGTLAAQASTQVVFPNQTESYGASSDPSDPSIAVCTIKTFPTTSEHAILWGKDTFTDLFFAQPTSLQKAIAANVTLSPRDGSAPIDHLMHTLQVDKATAQPLLEQLQTLYVLHKDTRTGIQMCIRQQIQLFEQLFHSSMEQLLQQHPPGSVDEDGSSFWENGRRMPHPISFDFQNPTHRDFILNAAFLRLITLGATDLTSQDTTRLQKAIYFEFERLAVTRMLYQPAVLIPQGFNFSQCKLQPQEFDKDDCELKHVDFVHAAASLRAAVFGLPPPEDSLVVRKVAGKIIPALSTTTGLAAGLVALELVKLAARKPTSAMRNSYSNLATANLAFTETVTPEEYTVMSTGETFTQWSKIHAPESVETIQIGKLVQFIEQRFDVQVSAITYQDQLVYAEFLPESQDVKGKTLSQALSDINHTWDAAEQYAQGRDFIDLDVAAEVDGEEQPLPRVRVALLGKSNSVRSTVGNVVSWGKDIINRYCLTRPKRA